ncbi:MAG: flagellar protein FliS [Candidatus Eisenbacteria sp.]|nr:flagellar protein FliS [Candidatus Eisenbacteria bacterium]
MPTRCPTATRDAVEAYSASKLESATPGQLVLQTYDYVISCCHRGETAQAKKGLVELMGALNLDHEEIAGPLFRMYEYCLDAIREGRFEEAIGPLSELREAWRGVIDQVESGAAAGGAGVQAPETTKP